MSPAGRVSCLGKNRDREAERRPCDPARAAGGPGRDPMGAAKHGSRPRYLRRSPFAGGRRAPSAADACTAAILPAHRRIGGERRTPAGVPIQENSGCGSYPSTRASCRLRYASCPSVAYQSLKGWGMDARLREALPAKGGNHGSNSGSSP